MTLLYVLLCVLLLSLLAGFGLALYFYRVAIDRRSSKAKALSNLPPKQKQEAAQNARAQVWAAMGVRDAYLTSADGLRLHALEADAHTGKWVVLQHGYTSDAFHMEGFAQGFYALGFGVLAPDARGHGESAGEYIGMGWPERKDILLWIDHILKREPQAQILLYGISMGAATMMNVVGEPLPPNVKGAIVDCGYTCAMEEFRTQLMGLWHYPRPLAEFILFFARSVVRLKAGYSLREADSLKQLKKARVPMLFLHGEKDRYVPFFMQDKVFAACASEYKRKLSFPGADHGESSLSDPERYHKAVEEFVAYTTGAYSPAPVSK